MRKRTLTQGTEFVPPEMAEAVAGLPAVVPLEEVASFLGVHPRTIRRWASSGRLRVLKTTPGRGGMVRVLRSEVARVLAAMQVPVFGG